MLACISALPMTILILRCLELNWLLQVKYDYLLSCLFILFLFVSFVWPKWHWSVSVVILMLVCFLLMHQVLIAEYGFAALLER